MGNPTKEIPIVKEQTIKDGKVVITEKEYSENTTSYSKGQIENYLSGAKSQRDDAQLEVNKWENMLKLI